MPTLRLFDADSDPLPVDTAALTVADIITLYLRHADVERIHCATARAERDRILPQFAADMGSMLVVDAKPYHLRDWVESNPRWVSVATRRAKANQVRAAFNWAFQNERIARHPFLNVRYAEAEPRPPMADDAFGLFAKHSNKRFEAAFRFLRYTGCRVAELCRAMWPHMDLDRGEWTIPEHKTRKYTRRAKQIALPGLAVELVRSQDRVADFVFVNTRGKPWVPNTLGTCCRWLKKRWAIQTPASLNGLRHACASAMLGNGAAIKMAAEQLGHATVETIQQTYYHRNDSHLAAMRAAAELGLPKEG